MENRGPRDLAPSHRKRVNIHDDACELDRSAEEDANATSAAASGDSRNVAAMAGAMRVRAQAPKHWKPNFPPATSLWPGYHRRAAVTIKLTALAMLLVACAPAGQSSQNLAALSHGEVVEKLAAGQVDSLPTGPVYVRFVRFAEPPGYVINSKQHVPSIVYIQMGQQRLILAGQAPIDLVAGQATFHQSVTHQHVNLGSEPSVWFSIAIWPSSARGQPGVDLIARPAFESEDFDRASLPQVAYSEVLRLVTLAGNGTSGAHRFGGLAAFYVLSGSISIKIAHHPTKTLGAGQGGAFPPDTDLQETDVRSAPATYLEFIVTAVGKDFEIPLQQPPAP